MSSIIPLNDIPSTPTANRSSNQNNSTEINYPPIINNSRSIAEKDWKTIKPEEKTQLYSQYHVVGFNQSEEISSISLMNGEKPFLLITQAENPPSKRPHFFSRGWSHLKDALSAKGGAVPATTAVGTALGTLIGGGVFLIIFFTGGLAAVPVGILGTIGTVSGGVGAAIGGVSGFLVSTSCVPACRNPKAEAQDGFFKVVNSLKELTKEQKRTHKRTERKNYQKISTGFVYGN